MGWLFIVLGGLTLLMSLVSPRAMWRMFAAWKYRDPAANEPSDTYFALQRAGAVVSGIILIVVGFVVNSALTGSALGAPDLSPAVEEAAASIEAQSPVRVEWASSDGHVAAEFYPVTALDELAKLVTDSLEDPFPEAADPPAISVIDSHSASEREYLFTVGGEGDRFCLRIELTAEPTVETGSVYIGDTAQTFEVGRSAPVVTSVRDGNC